MNSVPAKSLSAALAHVRSGGRLAIPTAYRCTVIDARCLRKWEAAGLELLREEGDGYRMRTGKSSVYLLPGQMVYA
jgi:hypothetical protein